MVAAGSAGIGLVQVTPVPPRAAKFAAVSSENPAGSAALTSNDGPVGTREKLWEEMGLVGLGEEELSHAAESNAKVTTTPAASLDGANTRTGRAGRLCLNISGPRFVQVNSCTSMVQKVQHGFHRSNGWKKY
jgi:hypothetical protein